MRSESSQDLATGIMFIAVGFAAYWIGADYPMGSYAKPGTGVLPRILAWFLMGAGVLLIGKLVIADFGEVARSAWKPVLVIAATTAIGYGVITWGLFGEAASVVVIVLASVALLILMQLLGIDIAWRQVLTVILATVAFGHYIDPLGILLTMVIAMTICALGTSETRWFEFTWFSAIMLGIGAGVFIKALGMPISYFPTKLPPEIAWLMKLVNGGR